MNARKYYPAILGSLLAVLATGSAAQSTPPAKSEAATQHEATTTSAPAKTHHAKAHHAKSTQAKSTHHAKAHHAAQAGTEHKTSAMNGRETPYQTALRRCVEGQAGQRDQCLDSAISRFGRS